MSSFIRCIFSLLLLYPRCELLESVGDLQCPIPVSERPKSLIWKQTLNPVFCFKPLTSAFLRPLDKSRITTKFVLAILQQVALWEFNNMINTNKEPIFLQETYKLWLGWILFKCLSSQIKMFLGKWINLIQIEWTHELIVLFFILIVHTYWGCVKALERAESVIVTKLLTVKLLTRRLDVLL